MVHLLRALDSPLVEAVDKSLMDASLAMLRALSWIGANAVDLAATVGRMRYRTFHGRAASPF